MIQPTTTQTMMQRLQEKIAADSAQIEALTQTALSELTKTLKTNVAHALSTIEDDIQHRVTSISTTLHSTLALDQRQVEQLSRSLTKAWLRPALVGALICLGIFGGSWGVTQWLAYAVKDNLTTLTSLQNEVAEERKQLAKIRHQTWGLELREKGNKRYVLLPLDKVLESGETETGDYVVILKK